MKKHNEGYTLPLVMVVMVILCLVAVSIMSVALRNLKAQQASVQRMQDQYVAAGMIEKVVAQLEATDKNTTASLITIRKSSLLVTEDDGYDPQTSPLKIYIKAYSVDEDNERTYYAADVNGNPVYYDVNDIHSEGWNDYNMLIVRIVATHGQAQITCELEFEHNKTLSYLRTVNSVKYYDYCVGMVDDTVTYLSYEVDYITTSETGGGQE